MDVSHGAHAFDAAAGGLTTSGAAKSKSAARRVLIIVENLSVPFDRRVWSEATTLRTAGYVVSVICPKAKDARSSHEVVDGIHIFRHPMPIEASGALGYVLEYAGAIFWEFALAFKVLFTRDFDVIHACNPPDLIFIVSGFFKLFLGKKFLFDHHDINPELYEAKFGRRGLLWKLMLLLERGTFQLADVSVATNQSYRAIAIERGRMAPDRVHVVRSGPQLDRIKLSKPDLKWRNGRSHLVGYVGVIGPQEGLDLLMASIHHVVKRGRSDIQFAIVGDGPALECTRALAEELGVVNFVSFFGRVDDETLFSILSTSDVCVNPDRPNAMNDKSTMNKILEYMALGKPIVQYDLLEGRFSAQDASLYARNVDPEDFADKILTLMDDPKKRAAMGESGRARVCEQLAWPHEAPKLLAAYDQIFEGI
jgi:glycosyltransferase involved in cell wall biosynthesis